MGAHTKNAGSERWDAATSSGVGYLVELPPDVPPGMTLAEWRRLRHPGHGALLRLRRQRSHRAT